MIVYSTFLQHKLNYKLPWYFIGVYIVNVCIMTSIADGPGYVLPWNPFRPYLNL